jgi:uncharacterized protein DUF1905/bacteriocin resistance YdeI/OmpD-like protein
MKKKLQRFSGLIEIIGINPFVYVPDDILADVFEESKKDKGKIPVHMTIDGNQFTQTLVRYSGHWRLYLNTPMRKAANKEVGDVAEFQIWFNPQPATIAMHPQLHDALNKNKTAREVFEALAPSRSMEIVRYISHLKTPESVERNVTKAINYLLGKEKFVGRELRSERNK